MKTALNVTERVEEYRFYSGAIGDVRPLPLKILNARLRAFYKVAKKSAGKGGKVQPGKARRRMRR